MGVMALVFVVLVGAGVLGWARYQAHQDELLRSSGIGTIDQMSGIAFEERLALLFRDWGYHVETTPRSGDYGADLLLSRGGERIIVQAKRSSRTVGVKAVQEVVSALSFYGGTSAMVITNAQFSQNAIIMAERLSIVLWDRSMLVQQLNRSSASTGSTPVPYNVPQTDGWLTPLLQWIENAYTAQHLRGRQILALGPSLDDAHTRTAAVMRLDANLVTLDPDDAGIFTPDRFPTPESLHDHVAEIPDYGVLWILALEQWDPDLLLHALFPWQERVFVLAFTSYPEQVDPVIRCQFSQEIPFQQAQTTW